MSAYLTCPVLTAQPAALLHDSVFEEAVEILLASSTVPFMDAEYYDEVPERFHLYL